MDERGRFNEILEKAGGAGGLVACERGKDLARVDQFFYKNHVGQYDFLILLHSGQFFLLRGSSRRLLRIEVNVGYQAAQESESKQKMTEMRSFHWGVR